MNPTLKHIKIKEAEPENGRKIYHSAFKGLLIAEIKFGYFCTVYDVNRNVNCLSLTKDDMVEFLTNYFKENNIYLKEPIFVI